MSYAIKELLRKAETTDFYTYDRYKCEWEIKNSNSLFFFSLNKINLLGDS